MPESQGTMSTWHNEADYAVLRQSLSLVETVPIGFPELPCLDLTPVPGQLEADTVA